MPQTVTVAAFVFGAVLLLIALLGGKFKIFGAEVSGTAGRVGRSFAAAGGIALITIGLYFALRPNASSSNPQPPGTESNSGVAPLTISSFQATPSQIKEGASAELDWVVQDASSVVVDQDIGSVPSRGSRAVSPKETTVYTLSASRGSTSVRATTQVSVVPLTWEDKYSVGTLEGDEISSFRINSYERDYLIAEVSYRYNPVHGQVWISGELLDENDQSISNGFFSTEATPTGTSLVRVAVDPQRGRVRSKWVFFWLHEKYKGEGFVSKRFPYDNFWN